MLADLRLEDRAICSDVYLRAPAALSIMIRELWSTSSRATALTRGSAASVNRPTPMTATASSSKLNFARSPTPSPLRMAPMMCAI